MVLINKYVDHGRNGLYMTEIKKSKKKLGKELIFEIEVKDQECIEILDGFRCISLVNLDQKKKIIFHCKEITKQLCEDNLFIHLSHMRGITLTKFFEHRYRSEFWNIEDKIELFLKVCERMYNKIDYNFVISIKRKDGSENIKTFVDNSYIDYINKVNNDSYIQVTIDNVKCYDPDFWIKKIEEMYYEVENFAERLNVVIESFLTTPGMLFKKLKNGIPFGLWLVSQFIDTGDDHNEKITITKQKLGQMFFEEPNVFSYY